MHLIIFSAKINLNSFKNYIFLYVLIILLYFLNFVTE